MITEKDMQYVLTIANYGNLTKAANALFLSQPALSIHLRPHARYRQKRGSET